MQHIEAADVRAAYEASDGLCLPHLQQAIREHGSGRTELLVSLEREKMQALAAECAGFVAKADYRYQGEVTRGEGNAWKRSARKLGGGWDEGAA
jgi:hypothetical protein